MTTLDGYYGEAPVSIAPFNPNWDEYMHFMYLPVRIPESDPDYRGVFGPHIYGDGRRTHVYDETLDRSLPPNLGFLRETILRLMNDAATTAEHLSDPYVYVTARRGYATPGNPLNRPGWHCDDFGGDDLNYIWTDAFPTRFLLADEPIDIPADDTKSMDVMEAYAYGAENPHDFAWDRPDGLRIEDGPAAEILRLSPYVIHSTPEITEAGPRSFFKISVSDHRYDLIGNAHNYLLDYNWPMYDRQALRNQPGAFQNKDYSGITSAVTR